MHISFRGNKCLQSNGTFILTGVKYVFDWLWDIGMRGICAAVSAMVLLNSYNVIQSPWQTIYANILELLCMEISSFQIFQLLTQFQQFPRPSTHLTAFPSKMKVIFSSFSILFDFSSLKNCKYWMSYFKFFNLKYFSAELFIRFDCWLGSLLSSVLLRETPKRSRRFELPSLQ